MTITLLFFLAEAVVIRGTSAVGQKFVVDLVSSCNNHFTSHIIHYDDSGFLTAVLCRIDWLN